MTRVFLGPAIHWLIVVVLCGLGWGAGQLRLHVTDFNVFVIVLILCTVAVLVAVLATTPPDRQVTRDPIRDPDEADSSE